MYQFSKSSVIFFLSIGKNQIEFSFSFGLAISISVWQILKSQVIITSFFSLTSY